MKPFNRLWLALMESKLAIALFAGLFVGAVVLLSVPPQFPVHGGNGELLWRIAKLVSCDVRLGSRNLAHGLVLNYPSSLAGLAGKLGCRLAGGEDERSCTATSRCGSRLDNVCLCSPVEHVSQEIRLFRNESFLRCCGNSQRFLEDRSPTNSDKHFAANMIPESPVPTAQSQEEEATSYKSFTGQFMCTSLQQIPMASHCSLMYFEKFLYITFVCR